MKNILQRLQNKNANGVIYADDRAIWCNEEHISTANYRLQLALQQIQAWTKAWLVRINGKKTTYTVFCQTNNQNVNLTSTLSPSEQMIHISWSRAGQATYLEKSDPKKKNQKRAKIRMSLMEKLPGTCWGKDQRVQEKLYIGRIPSQLNVRVEITPQWIHGNVSADILAKKGNGPDQHDKSVSKKDEKIIIKSLTARKCPQKHHDRPQPLLRQSRASHPDQIENRMNVQCIVSCPHDTAPMTSQYQLQDHSLHDAIKREPWPKDTCLTSSLVTRGLCSGQQLPFD